MGGKISPLKNNMVYCDFNLINICWCFKTSTHNYDCNDDFISSIFTYSFYYSSYYSWIKHPGIVLQVAEFPWISLWSNTDFHYCLYEAWQKWLARFTNTDFDTCSVIQTYYTIRLYLPLLHYYYLLCPFHLHPLLLLHYWNFLLSTRSSNY